MTMLSGREAAIGAGVGAAGNMGLSYARGDRRAGSLAGAGLTGAAFGAVGGAGYRLMRSNKPLIALRSSLTADARAGMARARSYATERVGPHLARYGM